MLEHGAWPGSISRVEALADVGTNARGGNGTEPQQMLEQVLEPEMEQCLSRC